MTFNLAEALHASLVDVDRNQPGGLPGAPWHADAVRQQHVRAAVQWAAGFADNDHLVEQITRNLLKPDPAAGPAAMRARERLAAGEVRDVLRGLATVLGGGA